MGSTKVRSSEGRRHHEDKRHPSINLRSILNSQGEKLRVSLEASIVLSLLAIESLREPRIDDVLNRRELVDGPLAREHAEELGLSRAKVEVPGATLADSVKVPASRQLPASHVLATRSQECLLAGHELRGGRGRRRGGGVRR